MSTHNMFSCRNKKFLSEAMDSVLGFHFHICLKKMTNKAEKGGKNNQKSIEKKNTYTSSLHAENVHSFKTIGAKV